MTPVTKSSRWQTPEERARELLRQHLSPPQRIELAKTAEITVRGSLGGTYCIHVPADGIGHRAYVAVMPGHNPVCLNLTDRSLPVADQALAYLLLIRTNEAALRATANHPVCYPRV